VTPIARLQALPLVSIILPTFGRPELLNAAVRSVQAQTFHDWELIIVDDGSDPHIELAGDLERDGRITLVRHRHNQGAPAARNTGVRHANGKFIAFLDSDDVWRPHKLEYQLEHAGRGDPVSAWVTGFRMEGATINAAYSLVPRGASGRDFAKGCWFCPGSTLLIERRVLDQIGPFNEELPRLEDYEWFFRFGAQGGRLGVVPHILVDIRVGARPSSQKVFASTSMLRRTLPHLLATDRITRQRVLAYLALEEAAAMRNEARYGRMLEALARSFLALPRRQLYPDHFWEVVPDEPSGPEPVAGRCLQA